jgi:hypothetical protein
MEDVDAIHKRLFKISLFLSEGVKIDFENTECASDVMAVKWAKIGKIRDQIFMAPGIPPSPNTSRIVGHTWK